MLKYHYLFLIFVLVFTGCSNPNTELIESAPMIAVSFQDDLGRNISLRSSPMKIVSLSPAATEIFFAIGANDRLIARSQICDFPVEALDLPEVQSYPLMDLKQIAELKPDLVITSSDVHDPTITRYFDGLKYPLFYLSSKSLEDAYGNITAIGNLTDHISEATHLVDSLRKIEKKITDATANQIKYATLAILQVDSEVVCAGGSCLLNELIEKAGGKNIYWDKNIDFVIGQEENLIKSAPEFVILATNDEQMYSDFVAKFPTAHLNMPAAQNKQVFMLDPELIRRGGPRMMEGLATLTRTLHSRINVSEFFDAKPETEESNSETE